jgi:hypothetical protein
VTESPSEPNFAAARTALLRLHQDFERAVGQFLSRRRNLAEDMRLLGHPEDATNIEKLAKELEQFGSVQEEEAALRDTEERMRAALAPVEKEREDELIRLKSEYEGGVRAARAAFLSRAAGFYTAAKKEIDGAREKRRAIMAQAVRAVREYKIYSSGVGKDAVRKVRAEMAGDSPPSGQGGP